MPTSVEVLVVLAASAGLAVLPSLWVQEWIRNFPVSSMQPLVVRVLLQRGWVVPVFQGRLKLTLCFLGEGAPISLLFPWPLSLWCWDWGLAPGVLLLLTITLLSMMASIVAQLMVFGEMKVFQMPRISW